MSAAAGSRVGWELARDASAVHPVTTAGVLPEAGTFDAGGEGPLQAGTHLVIEMGPDGAVAGFAVGLGLAGSGRRASVFGPPRELQAVAGADPLRATLAVGDGEPDAGDVVVDVAATVTRVADLLAAAGQRLEAGDRILAPATCHATVAPGDDIVAEIGGLGRVSARIAG